MCVCRPCACVFRNILLSIKRKSSSIVSEHVLCPNKNPLSLSNNSFPGSVHLSSSLHQLPMQTVFPRTTWVPCFCSTAEIPCLRIQRRRTTKVGLQTLSSSSRELDVLARSVSLLPMLSSKSGALLMNPFFWRRVVCTCGEIIALLFCQLNCYQVSLSRE